MEHGAVLDLIREKVRQGRLSNPNISRPPTFSSASFRAEIVDIHPRNNGDVRITFTCPYEDRHLAFSLSDAWGANLYLTVERGEDYTTLEAGVLDLTHRRNRTGRQPRIGLDE